MMNNPNVYRSITIAGILFIFFSISYVPVRIESLLEKSTDTSRKKEELIAEEKMESMEYDLLRQQMNELNQTVNEINIQINSFINHTGILNDSINSLMTRSVSKPELLDTIQDIYNNGILAEERKIDSLNQFFSEKSNELIHQIRVFNTKDRDLKILHAGIQAASLKHKYASVFIIAQFVIFILTFFFGIFLFIRGLKKWKKSLHSSGETDLQL